MSGCLNQLMYRMIVSYGLVLGGFSTLLQWLEFRHMAHGLDSQAYMAILCSLFAITGIWLGARIFPRDLSGPFAPNEKALRSLGLSAREHQVLGFLAGGHSNKEIARLLGISPHTVKTHVANVLGKLDANRRTQAIRNARRLGILP